MSAHANLERRRQAIYGWLLLSPALLLLSVFAFYPTMATFWSSLFSRGTRRNPVEYIGTGNYSHLCNSRRCTHFISTSTQILSGPLDLIKPTRPLRYTAYLPSGRLLFALPLSYRRLKECISTTLLSAVCLVLDPYKNLLY